MYSSDIAPILNSPYMLNLLSFPTKSIILRILPPSPIESLKKWIERLEI